MRIVLHCPNQGVDHLLRLLSPPFLSKSEAANGNVHFADEVRRHIVEAMTLTPGRAMATPNTLQDVIQKDQEHNILQQAMFSALKWFQCVLRMP